MKDDGFLVIGSVFKGVRELDGKIYGYTYELTFNKSLEHTGRFKGIENGLNEYVKKEEREDFIDTFKSLGHSFIKFIKNFFK